MKQARGFTARELDTLALELDRDGICTLKGLFDPDGMRVWAAAFEDLVERRRGIAGGLAPRGPGRFYLTLPWADPFADASVFANPAILGVIDRVFAQEYAMVQLAVDTPTLGSGYQEIHRDHRPLFTEDFHTPLFALAVNFPLCEVTAENGPLEMARGSHRLAKQAALDAIASGALPLEAFPMDLGDVSIRSPYAMHRGTPNRTDRPRPMVVMGYVMHWLRTAKVDLQVPRDIYQGFAPAARELLRCEVVDRIPETKAESYVEFKY
jgi:hypothetical protein